MNSKLENFLWGLGISLIFTSVCLHTLALFLPQDTEKSHAQVIQSLVEEKAELQAKVDTLEKAWISCLNGAGVNVNGYWNSCKMKGKHWKHR